MFQEQEKPTILMTYNYQTKMTMKKTLNNLAKFLMLLVLVTSCQDDDKSFGDLTAPSNLTASYEIIGKDAENPNGDGSGKVALTAQADNAISYRYMFPDGSSKTVTSGQYTKRFTTEGVNSYEVVVVAYGKGGVSTSITLIVEDVLSNFNDPVTTELLTNNSSKTWYWAAATQGHLGVGPNTVDGNNYYPDWYAAAPFEKAGSESSSCIYEDELTFTLEGENTIKYTLNNGGATFFNVDYVSVAGGDATEDTCYEYDTSGEKNVLLGPAESVVAEEYTTGTAMTFSDGGFMGYYIGADTYEILDISETQMTVRAVQGNNSELAWYHIFTTQPPIADDGPVYDNLIWSDEFDVDGAPDANKWNMEIGNNNGWGNNELQYYRAENATVEGGFLKITAKKEPFNGYQYTSARMTTHNNLDFTYGKVEVRAKLPSGAGTWPAIWLLGSNYTTTEWPACGEIDIMEHVGNDQNTIHGTLHYPGNSGGNGNTSSVVVEGVSEEFHVYSVYWSPDIIRFYVDDNEYKTFANTESVPFNWDFFVILNVAMGGTFGGSVDPNFVESTMEVDYVKVYQE